jgi:hypothetical protein
LSVRLVGLLSNDFKKSSIVSWDGELAAFLERRSDSDYLLIHVGSRSLGFSEVVAFFHTLFYHLFVLLVGVIETMNGRFFVL